VFPNKNNSVVDIRLRRWWVSEYTPCWRPWRGLCLVDYGQTWCHPQNRK